MTVWATSTPSPYGSWARTATCVPGVPGTGETSRGLYTSVDERVCSSYFFFFYTICLRAFFKVLPGLHNRVHGGQGLCRKCLYRCGLGPHCPASPLPDLPGEGKYTKHTHNSTRKRSQPWLVKALQMDQQSWVVVLGKYCEFMFSIFLLSTPPNLILSF